MIIDTPAQLQKPIQVAAVATAPNEGLIGDFIRKSCGLNDEQVQRIVSYQRDNDVRFGEAAVALKLVSRDAVLRALSKQFDYPVMPASLDRLGEELVMAIDPFGPDAEAFRDLRSHLLMDPVLAAQRLALAVLSPQAGDGKTYLAANLATAFAQLGSRTLLVDADMRRPRQHHLFGLDNKIGLSNVLSSRAANSAVQAVEGLPSLYVLPAGAEPPNPLELLQRPMFAELLGDLRDQFDHVVVDTPAVAMGADARVIAAKTGAALLVGRRHHSAVGAMQALQRPLSKSLVHLAGVVLNDH